MTGWTVKAVRDEARGGESYGERACDEDCREHPGSKVLVIRRTREVRDL